LLNELGLVDHPMTRVPLRRRYAINRAVNVMPTHKHATRRLIRRHIEIGGGAARISWTGNIG
jgi:hypothetical protein